MHYKQITRTAANGIVERPWRNRSHQFVLGDPAEGAHKHHDAVAVKVDNYGEALELVERGFSIRMSDGRNAPSLVAPSSLTLSEEPIGCLDELWTYTVPVPPFSKDRVLQELRKTLWAETCKISNIAGADAAESFCGGIAEDYHYLSYNDGEYEKIDLSKFNITRVVEAAYAYSFTHGAKTFLSEEDADELEIFLELPTSAFTDRFYSPMNNESSAIRMTTEMAYARWQLREGSGLTIKRMAFLARMTENAVRNSLSKLKLKPTDGLIGYDMAHPWLEARRDFLPQREDERLNSYGTWAAINLANQNPLGDGLTEIVATRPDLAKTVNLAAEPLSAALGSNRLPTVSQVRSFARAMEFNIDTFVVNAITAWESQLS